MSPSSASSNWPSSLSVPSPDEEERDDTRDEGNTSGDVCGDTDDGWAEAGGSACNRGKLDISFHGESRKSCVSGEIDSVLCTVGDVCLGGIGV